MRLSKIAIWGLVISFGASAQLNRGKFDDKSEKLPNLIREGESVSVLGEQGVQELEQTSRRVYGFTVGAMRAEQWTLNSYDNRVRYDLSSPKPAVGAIIGYFPFQWRGLWGFQSSINYTSLENNVSVGQSQVKTALHWVMTDFAMMYRGEDNPKRWFKPEAGIGGNVTTVIQRGPDGYNTSEARGMGVGILGVGTNMTRAFALRSPLQWDLLLQYKRFVGPSKSSVNLNGDMVNIGLTLAL